MSVVGSSERRVWVQAAAGSELLGDGSVAPGRFLAPSRIRTGEHPWDEAHRLLNDPVLFEFADGPVYAEPDLVQEFPHEQLTDHEPESFSAPPCAERPPDPYWPTGEPAIGWHLDNDHSGLKAARECVGDPAGRRIRIGLLDTGYDPGHESQPLHLRIDLARNFVGGDPNDATDPGRHFPWNQPGHGTATAALLAGRRVSVPSSGFNDFLGGSPFADVVPIRIADSVVHFRTSSMAAGIDYAVESGCEVVSISMGGIPSRAWAAAVNRAYEAGVAIFAAAGNRFGPSPPTSIVYPARFGRVVAVCGVTANGSPYYRSGFHRHMQGCFGPTSKMPTAMAAYTPNTPWAIMGCPGLVGYGGGTSSATPQAAAAAALWLQSTSIPPGAEPWRKVEAVRRALFSTARKDLPESERYFGQGVLRARAALDVPFAADLAKTPADSVSFPWLRAIGVLESLPPEPAGQELMFEVEALQVYLQSPHLQELAGGADPHADSLSKADFGKLLSALRATPAVSRALRDHLTEIHRRLALPLAVTRA
jgi:hypothetical protein